jgi:uncharacterized protein YdhG (YjbR/CyaY superfamily)
LAGTAKAKGKSTVAAKAGRKAASKSNRKPTTIDEYLAPLSADQRAALERLRTIIHATAPDAVECISYQIPAFKLHGKGLIWFAAARHHCAIYPVSNDPALKDYDTSGKGTLRFTVDAPLPAALVRKLVRFRMSTIAASR